MTPIARAWLFAAAVALAGTTLALSGCGLLLEDDGHGVLIWSADAANCNKIDPKACQ
jgi:hypothetical protein